MTNVEKEKHLMISIIIVSILLGGILICIICRDIKNVKTTAPTNQSQTVTVNTNNTESKEPNKHDVSNKIDLNTATEKVLESLPTLGKIKAKEIIYYRNTNGDFKNVNDLLNVKGITENNIKSIINLVEVY